MSLGENIARLRAERNLSQGCLADALDVSRQSVSKWETDSSVPELERLMQMSELFGVSLDELVKGKPEGQSEPEPAFTSEPPSAQTVIIQQQALSGQKLAGIILLGVNLFTTVLFLALRSAIGLLISVPLALCGIVCLAARRRVGLWCGWTVYCCADLFLRYGTGLTWQTVFFSLQWSPQANYARLATAWVQFLVMVLMVVFTLRSYRAEQYTPTKKRNGFLITGWMLYALRRIVSYLPFYQRILPHLYEELDSRGLYFLSRLLGGAVDYAFLALLLWLLVTTLGVWRWKKTQKNDG